MVVLRRYVKQTKKRFIVFQTCMFLGKSQHYSWVHKPWWFLEQKQIQKLPETMRFQDLLFFCGFLRFFFLRGFLHSRLMRCKHFLAFFSPSPKTSRRADYRPAFSIKSGWRCGNLAFFLSKSDSKKRSGYVMFCMCLQPFQHFLPQNDADPPSPFSSFS